LPIGRDPKPFPLATTRFNETQARFSPDGRWVAYTSDESGVPQVFVRATPPGAAVRQVSTDGGAQPTWSKGGRELFYLAPDGTLTVVPIASTPLEPGTPQSLFQTGSEEALYPRVRNHYAVTTDGERFLLNRVKVRSRLEVALNWAEDLD
jgi:serine/threonine-protein kinase